MNPEEVLINFVVDNAQALKASKAVEESIESITGALDKFHKTSEDGGEQFIKTMAEKSRGLEKLNDATKNGNNSLKEGAFYVGLYTASFKWLFSKVEKVFSMAMDGSNALIGNMNYLRVSSAMTAAEMERVTNEIIDAATATGLALDQVAIKARTLYDYSGLKEGLGDVIVSGEHMNRVFGMSGEEFGRMAATSARLSDGILTGSDMMRRFDRTVGITGYRMETMLVNLENIAKTLGRITGGGAGFAHAMGEVTEYVGEVSGILHRMGGDAEAFQEMLTQFLDPGSWNDIAHNLGPAIAGNFVTMNQMLEAGRMDEFHTLLVQSAKETSNMAQGMNAMQRAAFGADFRQLEILADLTPENMRAITAEMRAQNSVAERSAALVQNLGDAAQRMWTILSAVAMRLVMPFMEEFTAALSSMNESLDKNRDTFDVFLDFLGGVARYTGMLVGLLLHMVGALSDIVGTGGAAILFLVGFLGVMKLFRIIINAFFGDIIDVIPRVGKAVGDGFKQMTKGMKKGLENLKLGLKGAAVLVLVAGSLFLMAHAIKVMSEVPFLSVIGSLILLIGVLLSITLLAKFLAPAIGVLYALAFAFIALGAGTMMFAAASILLGTGLEMMVEPLLALGDVEFLTVAAGFLALAGAVWALGIVMAIWAPSLFFGGMGLMFTANAMDTINRIGVIDKDVIKSITGAIKELSKMDVDSKDVKNSLTSVSLLIDFLARMSTQVDDLVDVSVKLGRSGHHLRRINQTLFDKDTGVLTQAISNIYDSLTTEGLLWGRNAKDVSKPLENMNDLIGILDRMSTMYEELIIMGMMMGMRDESGKKYSQFIKDGITSMLNSSIEAIQKVYDILVRWHGSKVPGSAVWAAFESITSTLKAMSEMYVDIVALSMFMIMPAGNQTMMFKFGVGIHTMIDQIAGVALNLFNKLARTARKDKVPGQETWDALNSIIDVIKKLSDVYIDIAIMGAMMGAKVDFGGRIRSIYGSINDAIVLLFGGGQEPGIMGRLIERMDAIKNPGSINDALVKSFQNTFDIVKLVGKGLNELTVMGVMLDTQFHGKTVGEHINNAIDSYATVVEGINTRMKTIDTSQLSSVAAAMTDITASVSENMRISTDTRAEVALEDLNESRAEHEATVEQLLVEIRDGIRNQKLGAGESQVVQQVRTGMPWENPFSSFDMAEGGSF